MKTKLLSFIVLCTSVTVGLMMCAGSISYAGSGAIYYSPNDGAVGYSNGYEYLIDAIRSAQNHCNSQGVGCRLVATEQNHCVHLAIGADRFGWGTGYDEAEAIAVCSRHTTKCSVMYWICN
jgi:Domain of unknown function (DUF4189)